MLWINGPFGVGKTTTARIVREREPSWRLFDPESVGYMLRANLADVDAYDFQDLPAWRALVPLVASEIASGTGDNLLAVQTVLVEEYWLELERGFDAQGLQVRHVLLDADDAALRARIAADACARQWRLDHVAAYESARSWMRARAELVVDTTGLTATEAADRIRAAQR
jgi:hypothetical protein